MIHRLKINLFLQAQMKNFEDDKRVLEHFRSITLSEMDSVKLMNRTDTKFVFQRSQLLDFLDVLKSEYRILNVEGNLVSTYKTLYFDQPDFQYFLDHHNGKGNRYKVRIRNYVESNLFFFEIKNKYKERTLKSSISVDGFEEVLSDKTKNYANHVIDGQVNLEAKLWNNFQRISLVNVEGKERLTFDLGLSFDWAGKKFDYNHIVIAELKQEKASRDTLFYSLMKKNGIRPSGLSKYCVGAVALYPELKYNNFKEKLLLIDKLM